MMEVVRGLIGPLCLALLAVWLVARERPVLAAITAVAAVGSMSVLVLPVRRRRTPGAAILFTDIVESTTLMSSLGDAGWSEKLGVYENAARSAAGAARAAVTKSTGDGFLVVFVGPRAAKTAVECATRVRAGARAAGLETRAAVHVGDCLVSRGDATGLAVHIAARAMGVAAPGEIVVTETAREMLRDGEVPLEHAGVHELRGVPEPQTIYRVGG